MRTVSVTEFKAHCLRLFDEVEAGETIEVTRRGRVVGVIKPVEVPKPVRYEGGQTAHLFKQVAPLKDPDDWKEWEGEDSE